MKRGAFIIGLVMMLTGIYFFWMYLDILWNGDFIDSLVLWIVSLVIGTILISLGPGVMVWAYASSYEASYKQIAKLTEWQFVQIPVKCSECGNDLSIRTLEWIGDDEARCPFCSKDIEIRTSRSFA
jgi:hypothetical protein